MHGRTPKPVSYSSVHGKHKITAVLYEKRSATCPRRNSCEHDWLFRYHIKEWHNLKKLAFGLPLVVLGAVPAFAEVAQHTAAKQLDTPAPAFIPRQLHIFVYCNADKAAVHLVNPEGAFALAP